MWTLYMSLKSSTGYRNVWNRLRENNWKSKSKSLTKQTWKRFTNTDTVVSGTYRKLQICMICLKNPNSMGIFPNGTYPMWQIWKVCFVIIQNSMGIFLNGTYPMWHIIIFRSVFKWFTMIIRQFMGIIFKAFNHPFDNFNPIRVQTFIKKILVCYIVFKRFIFIFNWMYNFDIFKRE